MDQRRPSPTPEPGAPPAPALAAATGTALARTPPIGSVSELVRDGGLPGGMLIDVLRSTATLSAVVFGEDGPSAAALAESFFSRYAGRTLEAYRGNLRRYSDWAGIALADLPALLVAGGAARAHVDAERYRAHLRDVRRCGPSAINVALAALRSLVRFLRRAQLCSWTLDVPSERARAYRDTRGPGVDAVMALVDAAESHRDARMGARDAAIVALLFDLALRRSEVVSLDLAHVERSTAAGATPARLHVREKGHGERRPLSLPPATARALAAWISARGAQAGPLFVSLDPGVGRRGRTGAIRAYDGRLSDQGLAALLARLARRAGLPGPVRAHAIRHTAITAALDAGLDIRATQRFSRHADPRTLLRYDDNRTDLAGQVAAQVSQQRQRAPRG